MHMATCHALHYAAVGDGWCCGFSVVSMSICEATTVLRMVATIIVSCYWVRSDLRLSLPFVFFFSCIIYTI